MLLRQWLWSTFPPVLLVLIDLEFVMQLYRFIMVLVDAVGLILRVGQTRLLHLLAMMLATLVVAGLIIVLMMVLWCVIFMGVGQHP